MSGPRERLVARALLALLVGFLAALIAFPSSPIGGLSIAQESPSPSPTESPPPGPEIHFVNPSGPEPAIISDQDLDTHGYHFVAWVSEQPPNPSVEIRATDADDVEVVIGTAAPVGEDTYQVHWIIPEDFAAGTYTVSAILFSGQEEISRDEMEAEIDPAIAAVRIDYPVNGSTWGVYLPPGEDQEWAGLIDFTFSSGVRFVDAFYTTSAPGSGRPEWISCGSLSGLSGGPDVGRIRCTLDAEDDGRNVTGVRLVPDETPAPLIVKAPMREFEGSADGHRVLPYFQVAETVTAEPEDGLRTYPVFDCTSQFEAFVLDEFGRPIPRVNVDVHATGPTAEGGFSGMRFDTSDETDPNDPPDQNHTDTQSGWSCTESSPSGEMGNHPTPETADTRHIESEISGSGQRTDDNGRFTFRLRSDVPGGAQITAWADLDHDDQYCADEAAGHNSVGWDADPPTVVGHDPELEAGECEIPIPPDPNEGEADEVQQGPCAGFNEGSRQPREDGTEGEVIVGTPGDDNLEGGSGDDIICGLGGDDNIEGLEGADLFVGGPGADTISGNGGGDTIRGNGGADAIQGNAGGDTIRGGAGGDDLRGQLGRDTIRGQRGPDTLRGGRANDSLGGGGGNDVLNGGPGRDRCRGGPGNDTLRNCER